MRFNAFYAYLWAFGRTYVARGYSVLGGEQLSRGKDLDNGGQSKQMGDLKAWSMSFFDALGLQ